MTRCVLLLRGVNVGRSNRIRMPDLVALLEGLGCTGVTTHLQSGNALLTTADEPGALSVRTEAALAAAGVPVRVLARTRAELDDVVAACPWPDRDPALLHVAFLDGEPDLAGVDRAALLPEEVAAHGRHAYLWYAAGVRSSRLDRVLTGQGLTVTARNWRTTTALRDRL